MYCLTKPPLVQPEMNEMFSLHCVSWPIWAFPFFFCIQGQMRRKNQKGKKASDCLCHWMTQPTPETCFLPWGWWAYPDSSALTFPPLTGVGGMQTLSLSQWWTGHLSLALDTHVHTSQLKAPSPKYSCIWCLFLNTTQGYSQWRGNLFSWELCKRLMALSMVLINY